MKVYNQMIRATFTGGCGGNGGDGGRWGGGDDGGDGVEVTSGLLVL
jgi:hypothetical protein